MFANINDGQNIFKALDNALETMRTTVHTTEKKTTFELHFGRRPRLDVHSYLNIEPNVHQRFVLENQTQ